LPNVGPYIYTTLAFLALLGAPYIYDISSLRVKDAALSRPLHHNEKFKTRKMLRSLAVYVVHLTVLQDKRAFDNVSKSF